MSSYFAFVWNVNEMESHRQTFFMQVAASHTIPNDLCSKLAFYDPFDGAHTTQFCLEFGKFINTE